MEEMFSRTQLIEKGQEMNIPKNTIFYWLKQLLKNGTVVHEEGKGMYRKKMQ